MAVVLSSGVDSATFDLDCFSSTGNPHQFSFQILNSCGTTPLTVVGPGTPPVLEDQIFLSPGTYYIGISTGDGSSGNFRLFASATSLPTLTPTPTQTATPTATSDFNLSSGVTTFTTGQYNFGNVHIYTGTAVTITGAVTFNVAGSFTLDSGATIFGDGSNAALGNQYPVGMGVPASGEGGGGGHAGVGGAACASPGGSAYDDPNNPAQMGSSGAGGGGSYEWGDGGGLFRLNDLTGTATLNGLISMAGQGGGGYIGTAGGGGSGGTINIQADTITGSGSLNVSGGAGGGGGFGCGGGGGSGGMIYMANHTAFTFSGGSNTNGGTYGTGNGGSSNGSSGPSGSFNVNTY